jgi:hypothetical protein
MLFVQFNDLQHQDIVLVRMTSDSIRPPEKRYGYRNGFAGLINVIREEKIRGLARGIGPNTVRGFFTFWFSDSCLLLLGARNAVERVFSLPLFLSLDII